MLLSFCNQVVPVKWPTTSVFKLRTTLNSSKSIYLSSMVGMQEETEISELEVRQIPDY